MTVSVIGCAVKKAPVYCVLKLRRMGTSSNVRCSTIAQNVQQSFAASVSWKRVSDKGPDEDTTDPTADPDNPGDTDDQGGGGGNTQNPGDGNEG